VLIAASALVVLAAAVPAPAACPVARDTPPIIDVAAERGRASLAFFLVGFSRAGHLAWLERRQGFDDDTYDWSLHIEDLVRDRQLVDLSFSMKSPGLDAFCAKHGAAVSRALEKHGVQAESAPRLEHPEEADDLPAVELRAGHSDPEIGKTPYQVILRGKTGTKDVGSVQKVDVASGEPPVGAPKLLGMLKSPLEPRVAVLVTQEMIGTEGVKVTVVSIFGGRLDKRWTKGK
jgi:hypothetical protein